MKLTNLFLIPGSAILAFILSSSLAAQTGPFGTGICTATCPAVTPLTAEETQTLAHMREEEKLARDVYRFLNEKWQLAAFDRIAQAEEQHFQSVGALLARYSIADPSKEDVPGVYTDPKFTALYAELTAKGAASLKAALEVGVAIEVLDIGDLASAIKETTKFDVRRVYSNLMNASLNHQEAFEMNLELLSAQ